MNTIRIYLTESGRIADLQKDFPLYQGQFQNKLLNVFVPTSILAPMFTSSGAVSADYVASTSTKIGMTYTARDGSIKTSKNYYMRYLKTLMYKGVEYALYERKLPKEFTFYAGQGENSPVLIINVVNIEQQSGDTPPLVLSVITSQTCHLDVMQSTFLDRDELDEPSELENLNAQVQALNAIMPLKQDKEDENINLEQKPAQKTVVGAINDLGELVGTAQTSADNAQQTADNAIQKIGDLSTLATDEKSTVVKAINEVDQHANNAVATANGAVATANEAKTTAQTAENNANSAVDKANDAVGKANEAIMKADAKATSIGFMTAKDAVTALNGYPRNQLKGGDTIWIVEEGTPDLWVTEVAQESVPYNYTTKDKFNQDLVDNKVLQIGYFKTAYQESDGKPVTIAWQNVVVKNWVASTEFADFPYEAKIELTDFVDYTTVPQVVFDIADTMSGNYAPICKSGDKCVYIYGKVQDEITLKTVITFAPNVNGASVTGGGYNNRGKWVASTTYEIDDLVYTDNGQYVCIEGITSTTSPEQDTTHWQATFVATGKTKNGLTISGQDNGTGVQKTFDGSTAVEMAFDEQTMTVKEVNGVLKVGAKGTVPEALPQETSTIKSGSLPTSGWTVSESKELFNGNLKFAGSGSQPTNNGKILQPYNYTSKTKLSDWAGTQLAGKNIEVCVIQTDSGGKKYISLYNNSGSGASSHTNFKINIYDDGTVTAWNYASYSQTKPVKIVAAFLQEYVYTISDNSITANSDVLMELTDNGGVKAYSMEAGKMTVIRDTAPTAAIPYTYKVKQTNASGQFTLVNHFVPSIPDSPTSLPVTYKKASGSLPTTGWATQAKPIWTGVVLTRYNEWVSTNIVIPEEFRGLSSGWEVTIRYNGGYTERLSNIYNYNPETNTFSFRDKNTNNALSMQIKTTSGNVFFSRIMNTSFDVTEIYNTAYVEKTYTISDTDITANTSVKMYLTDEGGVKAQSKASGSITVIRDSVPTTAIPYEYEVEETSGEGLFEVINAYVPDVPTKTSQLTNDSGFITANDIPSAGAWVIVNDDIPKATITEAGTYQVVVNFDVFDGSSQEIQTASCEIYFDSLHKARGTSSVSYSYSSEPKIQVGTYTPVIISENDGFVLRVESWLYILENTTINVHSQPTYAKFKYRKIN